MPDTPNFTPKVTHLGRLTYEEGYDAQVAAHARVLEDREGNPGGVGEVFLIEHVPVITISNRPTATANLIASEEALRQAGVAVARTDRGGDITYHGPGQLVVYPILDLNVLNLGLHDYMRMLEDIVIRVCRGFGVETMRDPSATGVWTVRDAKPDRKIAAMGVRVRKWISMHGLALNVTTNLEHFQLIVPCGLVGRSVTSLQRELGSSCPSMREVEAEMVREMTRAVEERASAARAARARSAGV